MKHIKLLFIVLFFLTANSVFAATQILCDFESGETVTTAGGATAEVVDNPSVDTVNATAKSLKIGRTSKTWWELVEIPVSFTLSANTTKYVHILINYPANPDIDLRLNMLSDDYRPKTVYKVNGEWQDMVFEISNSTSADIDVTKFRFLGDVGYQNTPVGQVLSQTAFGYIDEVTLSDDFTTGDIADVNTYLSPIKDELNKNYPDASNINVIFHGHSVPTGYFASPNINSVEAYPHRTFLNIKEVYPNALVNVFTTSIGGEQSENGAKRFDRQVLAMKPDVVFIDYALNDRNIGLSRAATAWRSMIEKALAKGVKVILMTPTPDSTEDILSDEAPLALHAQQIRELAGEYHIGLIDSYAIFKNLKLEGVDLSQYMAQTNHINEKGHKLVADEIYKWFK